MKRMLAATLAATALGVLTMIPGTPALAATTPALAATTPQCTTSRNLTNWAGQLLTMPVSSNGSTDCWLAKGDISSAVSALQLALKNCEGPQKVFTSLVIDGNYGPATKAAVTEVQNGALGAGDPVSVDGVYGPQTKSLMGFKIANGSGCGSWN